MRGKKNEKDLNPKEKKTTSVKKSTSKNNSGTSKNEKSSYFVGCEEVEVADMRQRIKCRKRYHEECVGLSVGDTDDSECC